MPLVTYNFTLVHFQWFSVVATHSIFGVFAGLFWILVWICYVCIKTALILRLMSIVILFHFGSVSGVQRSAFISFCSKGNGFYVHNVMQCQEESVCFQAGPEQWCQSTDRCRHATEILSPLQLLVAFARLTRVTRLVMHLWIPRYLTPRSIIEHPG